MDRNRLLLVVVALLSSGLWGCSAGITAHEVTTGNEDGLRYYLPVPYLIVEQSKDGKWDARIEMLVDRKREFTLEPWSFMGKSKAVTMFNPDGTLKSFALTQDTTTVPEALADALKDVGSKQLDLEKASLDKRIAAATTAATANPARLAATSEYQVFMYRIEGANPVVAEPADARVDVGAPPAAAVAPPEHLDIKIDPDDSSRLLITVVGRTLTLDQGKAGTFFDANGEGLSADKLASVREGLHTAGTGLTISKATVRAAGVKTVVIGTASGRVP